MTEDLKTLRARWRKARNGAILQFGFLIAIIFIWSMVQSNIPVFAQDPFVILAFLIAVAVTFIFTVSSASHVDDLQVEMKLKRKELEGKEPS